MKTVQSRNIFVCLLILALLAPLVTSVRSFAQAADSPLVSVKLVNYIGNAMELSVSVAGSYYVKDSGEKLDASDYKISANQQTLTLVAGTKVIEQASSIHLVPEKYGRESFVTINGRPYLGEVRFELEKGLYVRPVNILPLEDYLKGVVPREMPASWTVEALKAQAIAARTYAMRQLHKVIDDTVNFQVYGGYEWHENSTRAVDETRGQVLTHNGMLIDATYSSSNGGMAEASESIWNKVEYLPAQPDPYDPGNRWTLSLRKEQISLQGKDLSNPDAWWDSAKEADTAISNTVKKWLQQNGYANVQLKLVAIPSLFFHEEKTKGGRVTKGSITLDFLAKHPQTGYERNPDGTIKVIRLELADLPAATLRAMLGGGNVFKSYLIESLQQDEAGYTIHGLGYGHGVGMSQYGAKAMAEQGKKVEEILAFYYPGTVLSERQGQVIAQTPAAARTASPIVKQLPAVASLTSRSAGPAKTGIVKSTVVIGLRPKADFNAKPLKLLKNGDPVSIVGKKDRWYIVKSGTITGYVPDQYIVAK